MFRYHIQTIEVGAGGASSINLANIPQNFTDLVLKVSLRQDQGNPNAFPFIRFNGSSADLSSRYLGGTGTSTFSGAATGIAFWNATKNGVETTNTFTNDEIYIPNYTSSNQKSFSIDNVMENNGTDSRQWLLSGLWANTSPITSITIFSGDNTASPAFSFLQNSSISLYGIMRGSDSRTEVASGGVITTSGGYTIHTFNASGTFVANRNLNVDYLIVAGGGGGGQAIGYIGDNGGGGAGGLRSTVGSTGGGGSLESTLSLTSGTSYAVTVGSGGAIRTKGGNSSFGATISEGGGFGGPEQDTGITGNGGLGGSGGGSGNRWVSGIPSGGTGTINQGFSGGKSTTDAENSGGGGGGAGSVGGDANGATVIGNGIPGNGGNGVSVSISGASIPYAGGGGGGTRHATQSTGGLGGGGRGNSSGAASTPGTSNTGGGGGGAGTNGVASAGGSGIVIIRYLTP
jgi:hypothetical protein